MPEYFEILVVDESAMLRNFIATTLRRQLRVDAVHMAATVDEAIGLLNRHPSICMVFTEIEVGGKSGLDLIKILRQSERDDVPLLVVTDRTDKAAFQQAIEAGVTDYIVKPFSEAVLARKAILWSGGKALAASA